jgi:uncharacterized protein (DUF2236 family)
MRSATAVSASAGARTADGRASQGSQAVSASESDPIMELAEPRVPAGVWEHTTFRSDPLRRLRRTGLAGMVTVHGARSLADPMIRSANPRHGRR